MTERGRYAIEIRDDAEKALERLPKKIVTLLEKKISSLADVPRPRGYEKLNDKDYRL